MISLLTEKIIDIIKGEDNTEVYPEYDMIPVENKSPKFFMVVSPVGFSGKDVKNISAGKAYDFEINYDIICLTDMNCNMAVSYDNIQKKILERIISSGNFKVLEFKTGRAEPDYKIQKMKIVCTLKIGGIYVIGRKEGDASGK